MNASSASSCLGMDLSLTTPPRYSTPTSRIATSGSHKCGLLLSVRRRSTTFCKRSMATSSQRCSLRPAGRCSRNSITCALKVWLFLASSPTKSLGVEDHHGARFDAQQAACTEIGKRLVHRFSRCTDQLREFFLGEVVRDVNAFSSRLSEPVGESEQRLRHP